MKNGKKPNVRQCKLMQKWGLHSENWLVVKDTPESMLVVSRYGFQTREIPKEGK